jgi:hypothetical protein
VFWTASIQKDPIALAGIILMAHILVFLLSPTNIMDFTVVDSEYWRESGNGQIVKSGYNYNDKESIEQFPMQLGEWTGYNYYYPDGVDTLNAEIVLSRSYARGDDLVLMDIVHSKMSESFHKQQICVEGQGWTIVNESKELIEVNSTRHNPYITIYVNKLDIEKNGTRQVMMYWFMFKKFRSSNAVTMIRLLAPVEHDYQQTSIMMGDFIMNQLFLAMYENVGITPTIGETIIYGNKKAEHVSLFLALLTPLILIFNRTILNVIKKIF